MPLFFLRAAAQALGLASRTLVGLMQRGLDQFYGEGTMVGATTADLIVIPIPTNSTAEIELQISARRTDAAIEGYTGKYLDGFKNTAGVVARINAIQPVYVAQESIDPAMGGPLFGAFTISGTNVIVRTTGLAGKTFFATANVVVKRTV